MEKFKLFKPGDRVAVAVSGGKDSLTLLYLLSKYRDRLGVELVAVLVDEGISGYREYKQLAAEKYARAWGVRLCVTSFKEGFGFTLDEVVFALMMEGLSVKPCSACGVFRRYLLNRIALDLGADKLATAHNLDDEAQAFLMNAIQANLTAFLKEGIVDIKAHELLVPRVKPFYFTPEKEVMTYALLHTIESPYVECPYIVYSIRNVVRRWLNYIELEDPMVKYRVLALKELLTGICKEVSDFRTCKICGMPSSGDLCKACELSERVRSFYSRKSF
ncbi:MAG: TIGR00269 family protein [Thermofilaceae archaeon]